MPKPSVYLLSLGCAKNLIDSELLLGNFKNIGFEIKKEPKNVDLAIINTCAFIKEAKEESIEEILDFIDLKKKGEIKKLWVVGCLPQRYKEELKKEFPAIDRFFGVEAWRDRRMWDGRFLTLKKNIYNMGFSRYRLTPSHYTYLKLSEGCDNYCSYCIISKLRGPMRSRPIEEIIKEVRTLSENGKLKEINLIAQDTALYGKDIYGKPVLIELLKKLIKIEPLFWIRVLYMHPAHITKDLVKFIANNDKICRYFDVPIQHVSDKILKKMNRKITKKEIYALINFIRKEIKNVSLRTSLIVGFPGEEEKDFEELVEFVKEVKFEHLGVFVYSQEEGTPAYDFPEQIPEEVKKARFDYLLEIQKEICWNILKGFVGKVMKVIIDEKVSDMEPIFLGRTEYDAPEVDGGVLIKGEELKIGEFIKAKIVDTWEYDLIAQKYESS